MRPAPVPFLLAVTAAILAPAFLAGCRTDTASTAPAGAPTLAELRNATYSGFEDETPITLVDGRWQGPAPVEGGSARPSVTLVRDFRLCGDLTGDGAEESVVLLGLASGGTGEYIYLAVMGRLGGSLRDLGTALVGDRVQVREARVDSGSIVLDVVQAGPEDAMCCPGQLARRTWRLTPEGLVETGSVEQGRLTLAAAAGVEWVLRDWSWTEAVAPGTGITLRVDGGSVAGSAGCNRYTTTATAGETPGQVRFGPTATTMKACPEPEMRAETRFLERLAHADRFGFLAGALTLSWTQGDSSGVMMFARGNGR